VLEQIDFTQVNWARAQFALTALYHWIFVPLTLGLSFLVAFFETIYVKTGNESWKKVTKFWMHLFGVNFAIGVATGIIMEFEFGTNWSNYSWIVGDIFGAPLAIEGLFAFFLEATFFAVMFFGWDRVSKRFHCFSAWMVAIGSNLSAVWILVANGWMQNPLGMTFNPVKARFEMQSFFELVFNPVAVSKFTHTSSSGFFLASAFVVSVSCWFLLKKRHIDMAKKSIVVAAVFGLVSGAFVGFSGDEAAFEVAQNQPMKLAAMEGLWHGEESAGIVAVGVPNPAKMVNNKEKDFIFDIKVPGILSLLANRSFGSFVPGINDLVYGNAEQGIMSGGEKITKGKMAVQKLAEFKTARKSGDREAAKTALVEFDKNKKYLGYGYLEKPEDLVPMVPVTFYAFHAMVVVGTILPVLFLAFLFFLYRKNLPSQKWLIQAGMLAAPLAWIATESGWIVAEVGRQPWAIQDLLPVSVATSSVGAGTIQTTFIMFFAVFTLLLIAEVRIMAKQIKTGPEGE